MEKPLLFWLNFTILTLVLFKTCKSHFEYEKGNQVQRLHGVIS